MRRLSTLCGAVGAMQCHLRRLCHQPSWHGMAHTPAVRRMSVTACALPPYHLTTCRRRLPTTLLHPRTHGLLQPAQRPAAGVLLLLLGRRLRVPAAGLHALPAHHHPLALQVCAQLHAGLPGHHGRLHGAARLAHAAGAHDVPRTAALQLRHAMPRTPHNARSPHLAHTRLGWCHNACFPVIQGASFMVTANHAEQASCAEPNRRCVSVRCVRLWLQRMWAAWPRRCTPRSSCTPTCSACSARACRCGAGQAMHMQHPKPALHPMHAPTCTHPYACTLCLHPTPVLPCRP